MVDVPVITWQIVYAWYVCQQTKMAKVDRRLSEREIEQLIELNREEQGLWNVKCDLYSNADHHKLAMNRISGKLGGIAIGTYK